MCYTWKICDLEKNGNICIVHYFHVLLQNVTKGLKHLNIMALTIIVWYYMYVLLLGNPPIQDTVKKGTRYVLNMKGHFVLLL